MVGPTQMGRTSPNCAIAPIVWALVGKPPATLEGHPAMYQTTDYDICLRLLHRIGVSRQVLSLSLLTAQWMGHRRWLTYRGAVAEFLLEKGRGLPQDDPFSPICMSLLLAVAGRHVQAHVPNARAVYLDVRPVTPVLQAFQKALKGLGCTWQHLGMIWDQANWQLTMPVLWQDRLAHLFRVFWHRSQFTSWLQSNRNDAEIARAQGLVTSDALIAKIKDFIQNATGHEVGVVCGALSTAAHFHDGGPGLTDYCPDCELNVCPTTAHVYWHCSSFDHLRSLPEPIHDPLLSRLGWSASAGRLMRSWPDRGVRRLWLLRLLPRRLPLRLLLRRRPNLLSFCGAVRRVRAMVQPPRKT